jgi:hypothetical protein
MMCICRIIYNLFNSLTPDGSFAALTLKALVLISDGGKRGVSFVMNLLPFNRA